MSQPSQRQDGSRQRTSLEDAFRRRVEELTTRPKGRDRWEKMEPILFKLLQRRTVHSEMKTFLEVDKKQSKSHSHAGAIREGKRWVDKGNWSYSMLYCLMFKAAAILKESCEESMECHKLFLVLKQDPSLRPGAPYTDKSIGKKGDVIECILSTCRLKGPIVENHVRQDRQDTHDDFKAMLSFVDDLKAAFGDGENISSSQLPCPKFAADQIHEFFGIFGDTDVTTAAQVARGEIESSSSSGAWDLGTQANMSLWGDSASPISSRAWL